MIDKRHNGNSRGARPVVDARGTCPLVFPSPVSGALITSKRPRSFRWDAGAGASTLDPTIATASAKAPEQCGPNRETHGRRSVIFVRELCPLHGGTLSAVHDVLNRLPIQANERLPARVPSTRLWHPHARSVQ